MSPENPATQQTKIGVIDMKKFSTYEEVLKATNRMCCIDYYNRAVALDCIGKDGLVKEKCTADSQAIRYRYNKNKDEVVIGELKVRRTAGRKNITVPCGFDVLDCKVIGNGCKDIWFLDLSNIKRLSVNVDLSEFTNLRKITFNDLPVNHICYTWKGMMLFGIEIDGWAFEGNVDGTVSLVKNN